MAVTINGSYREGTGRAGAPQFAHAEGNGTLASSAAAHAEGLTTTASGTASHAEGDTNTAGGYAAHVGGGSCSASGDYSHAQGNSCIASGTYAHAEGQTCTASGVGSHAQGQLAVASRLVQFARFHGIPATGVTTPTQITEMDFTTRLIDSGAGASGVMQSNGSTGAVSTGGAGANVLSYLSAAAKVISVATLDVVAARSDANSFHAVWQLKAYVARNTAATNAYFIGTPAATLVTSEGTGWLATQVAVAINTAGGLNANYLQITVTTPGTGTYVFFAHLQVQELTIS
jgi:hypothetical protein